jgi:hypothetical protein
VALALLLALAVMLSGCSIPASTFDQAIGQGIAAVGTARLAVEQQLDDRIFPTTTITALGDARRELVDVRVEISGAPRQLLAETIVVGILVSPRSRTSTWGFERRGANAPAIIARPQHWLHRGMFLVAWADVARIDEGRVTLRDGYERLDPSLASTAHPH